MRNTKNLKVLFSLMLVFAVISSMFMTVMAEPEPVPPNVKLPTKYTQKYIDSLYMYGGFIILTSFAFALWKNTNNSSISKYKSN